MGYHDHETVEVSVVFHGQGEFHYGETKLKIDTGHVLFVPANVSHRFVSRSSIRFGVLQFPILNEQINRYITLFSQKNHPQIVRLNCVDLQDYESFFYLWLRFASRIVNYDDPAIATWILLILQLLKQYKKSIQKTASINKTGEYLQSNLKSAVTIQKLARMAGLSESAFRKKFHEVYGMSPKQFQQKSKLTEANWLLRSSNHPIQFIAEQIGFQTVHSFSRWFRNRQGVSPSEWRNGQQGKA